MKTSNQNTDETSFQNITIRTTANQLIEKLGFPNSIAEGVSFDWVCETEDGDVFTIYDYYHSGSLPYDRLHKFHIGSKSLLISHQAKTELQLLLKS